LAKWSRTRARPAGAAAVSWREVTPSVRAGRVGRARACAAGAVAAIAVAVVSGTVTTPSAYFGDTFWADAASRHLAYEIGGYAYWAFLIAALGWHFAIERRRRPSAPARLPGDGWLAFVVLLAASSLSQATWPFTVVGPMDPASQTFTDLPAAAAANDVLWLALIGALAVLGVLALTRRAERRDGIRAAWRALDREEPAAA